MVTQFVTLAHHPFKRLLGTLIALVSIPCWATPPNILFLYTDDQAVWSIGAFDPLHQASTPNIDRLVREGAHFTNAFVTTPVCSPARASLMTSRYGTELGITDFIAQKGHKYEEPDLGLDPKTIIFPEVLSAGGYECGLIGKWHLGALDKHHPTQSGFGYFMGHRGGGWQPDNPTLEVDGTLSDFEGLTTDILTDQALHFLEAEHQSPFFLAVHYRAPHSRWLPVAPEDWEPFKNLDPKLPHPDYPDLNTERVKKMMREYLASVRGGGSQCRTIDGSTQKTETRTKYDRHFQLGSWLQHGPQWNLA